MGEKVELKGNEKILKFLHLHDYQFVLIVQFCYFIGHFRLELLLLYLQESKFCIIRNIFVGFLVIFYSYFSLLGVFILHWTLYFPPPTFFFKKISPSTKMNLHVQEHLYNTVMTVRTFLHVLSPEPFFVKCKM